MVSRTSSEKTKAPKPSFRDSPLEIKSFMPLFPSFLGVMPAHSHTEAISIKCCQPIWIVGKEHNMIKKHRIFFPVDEHGLYKE
tara:strand:- start:4990 stop:5238 length:249 start_codon:yes stop_codon:yes gene_type:complete